MNKVRIEIEPLRLGRLILEKDIKEGATLKDLLNELSTTHPEVIEIFFDLQSQKLTGAAAISLNGRLIQILKGLETRLGNGDVIAFVPLLTGG